MNLATILKDSNYKLSQFTSQQVDNLEKAIIIRPTKSGDVAYIQCLVRGKEIKLTPEEAVRQLYLQVLTQRYDYPISRIAVEYVVTFGREKKKADIAIFDKDRPNVPYIIVELKKPKLKDGKEQLRSYFAQFLVWVAPEIVQQQIKHKVEESHQKREQSKQLLEIAKTGVEKAIETDETTAKDWMNQQLATLGINSLDD